MCMYSSVSFLTQRVWNCRHASSGRCSTRPSRWWNWRWSPSIPRSCPKCSTACAKLTKLTRSWRPRCHKESSLSLVLSLSLSLTHTHTPTQNAWRLSLTHSLSLPHTHMMHTHAITHKIWGKVVGISSLSRFPSLSFFLFLSLSLALSYTHTHKHKHIHTTQTHTHTHKKWRRVATISSSARSFSLSHIHIHIYNHTYTQTHIYTHIHTHTNTHAQKVEKSGKHLTLGSLSVSHTHTHTRTHTIIHTHIHTHAGDVYDETMTPFRYWLMQQRLSHTHTKR